MNEKLIRDLFDKLEHYGIKGFDVLCRGEFITSTMELIVGVLTIVPLVALFIFGIIKQKEEPYEAWVLLSIFAAALILGASGSLICGGISGMICPDYYVLKGLMGK